MRIWLSILLINIFITGKGLLAQLDSLTYQAAYEINAQYDYFAVDRLGQVIAARDNGDVNKYDAKGQIQFMYSNARLGELGLIDASNPFNLLLYYPEFQTLIQLDRTLNEIGRLDLREVNLPYSTAVARSVDDNIWVYDDWSYQLKKIDAQGQEILNSNDLREELGVETVATKIWIDREQVYLYFPEYGLAIFSNFGQFVRHIPQISHPRQLWQKGVLFNDDQEGVIYYNLSNDLSWPLFVPEHETGKGLDMVWIANKAFIRTQEAIIAFDIFSFD